MKYVLILIIFGLCTFVGYLFSLKYLRRKKFFNSLIAFADKLSLEINFSRERLKILIMNFDENNKKNLLDIDKKFVDFLDKKCELNEEEVFKKANILTAEEKNMVFMFLKTLGRSDVENQTKEIQNFLTRFQDLKNKCDEEQKKYGSLSLKLGIVVGLFCAIIMF